MAEHSFQRLLLATFTLAGCAGAEMSRFADEDGTLATEGMTSDDGGDELPSTSAPDDETGEPTTTSPADGGPVTNATTDGADETPVEDSSSNADSSGAPEESSSGEAEESSSGAAEESSSGALEESSSDDSAETSMGEDVDLSGYRVVQTNSARELVLPAGTIVPRGGTVVIARGASPGAFQDFWMVNWGDDVVFIDGADDFPNINGGETYALYDEDDTLIDGPSPVLVIGSAVIRSDADLDGDDDNAWTVDDVATSAATPGTWDATGGVSGTAYLSEYADPDGGGEFAYEYLEIGVAP